MRFSDLESTVPAVEQPTWSDRFSSVLAHSTGRLPECEQDLGWRPLSSPRPTWIELHRRSRIVRGEA